MNVLLWTVGLWWWYRGAMWLMGMRRKLRKRLVYPLAVLFVAAGALLDVLYNIFVATVLFVDLPREWLLTSRLKRYKYTHPVNSWRWRLAIVICEKLLDPYDPAGTHC